MKTNFFLALAGLLWALGCQKPIQADNTDQDFPLELRYSDEGNGYLSWNSVKVTRFEQYVLTVSNSPYIVGSGPINAPLFESTDPTISGTPINLVLPFDTITYIKLYARIDGRWIESNEVVLRQELLLYDGAPYMAVCYPDSNWVIHLKAAKSGNPVTKLVLSDLTNNKSYASTDSFTLTDLSQIAMSIGSGSTGPELYFTANNKLNRIALPSLTTIAQHNSVSNPYAVVQTSANTLLLAHKSSTRSLILRRKDNFSIIREIPSSSTGNVARTLAVLDTTPTGANVLEVSTSYVRFFHINTSTGEITNDISSGQSGNTVFANNLAVTKDRQQFLSSSAGVIRNRNLAQTLDFGTGLANMFGVRFAAFSEDDPNIIHILGNSFQASASILRKIKIDDAANFEEFGAGGSAVPTYIGRVNGGLVCTFKTKEGDLPRFVVGYINF
jgi:hypothetical protein